MEFTYRSKGSRPIERRAQTIDPHRARARAGRCAVLAGHLGDHPVQAVQRRMTGGDARGDAGDHARAEADFEPARTISPRAAD
jgi:hypothetical protein